METNTMESLRGILGSSYTVYKIGGYGDCKIVKNDNKQKYVSVGFSDYPPEWGMCVCLSDGSIDKDSPWGKLLPYKVETIADYAKKHL